MKRIITRKKRKLIENKNIVARIKRTVLKIFNRYDKRSRLNRRKRLIKNKVNVNKQIHNFNRNDNTEKINKLQKLTKRYRYDIYKNRIKNLKIKKI